MDSRAPAFVEDDRTLRVALDPLRRRLLEALQTPGSASQLAERLSLPRQKIGYHLRALEAAGLVRLLEERRRRGFTERVLVAADRYVIDPGLLAPRVPVDPDAVEAQDRHAADHLIQAASAIVCDVARMRQAATTEGTRLLTLTVEADLTFAQPADFEAFTQDLAEAVATLARRYGSQEGRRYRLVAGAHPAARDRPITIKN